MLVPIPPLGAGVVKKLPTGDNMCFAGVGRDGLDPGIRQQPALKMREGDNFSGSGPAIRQPWEDEDPHHGV